MLSYGGRIYFPFLKTYAASEFGEDYETEAPYSESALKDKIEAQGWILWAPIRFGASTIDFKLKEAVPSAPDSRHLLGTDDRGRDVFARLLFGFRLSLLFGLMLASIGALLGIFIGAMQGSHGSQSDLVVQRLTEIWTSIPELLALMILSSVFQPSFLLLLVFASSMGWMTYATYVRAEFLRLRHLDFVLCARQLGASRWHLALHHIIPNALTPVLSYFPLRVSSGITCLASLDFLGWGLSSSHPSLGELLLQGKAHLECWWIIVSSFCALSFATVLLHFISEGVLHALDPRVDLSP